VDRAEEVEANETLMGLSKEIRPVREPTAVRLTIPEKPLSPLIVIVEDVEEPAWTERDEGLVAIVKPVTPTLTGVEREIVPLIPLPVAVTVTVKAPGETEVWVNTVRVEVADVPGDNVTLFVLNDAPGPPETLVVKATVPLKPF
jgi:hypothetical protein